MPLALPGIGVSKGIAIGKARVLQRGQLEVLEYALAPDQIEEEVARFRRALHGAREQLKGVRTAIPSGTPDEIAAFIDTHLLMLEDATLAAAPIELIRERRCNAEWALKLQQDVLVKVFDAMEDPYLKTRRDDVEHVVQRIQWLLLNQELRSVLPGDELEEPRIILAFDLAPSDLMLLHQQQIAAIVTARGGPLSHTAILARSLQLPAIVGVHRAYQYIADDETVVVDGDRGVLLAGLQPQELSYFRKRQHAHRANRAKLRQLKEQPAVTLDGVAIDLHANIERGDDVPAMRRVGATGVGLFRTEFLYMNRSSAPGEEEQFEVYRKMVQRLKGLPLTIRTLDLGGDKEVTPGAVSVPNPALGLRAIRYCLKELGVFRTQLRAILRASAYGPVKLLLPMLTNLAEVRQARQLMLQVMDELTQEKRRFDAQLAVGGMIEVPAAALCAEGFAAYLDFLSIGTNDLIQYTLATDRIDDDVNHLYDPLHPAVLRLVRTVIQAGRQSGTEVAMCGEMAGDPDYTRLLLGLGLTQFSMLPGRILEVKEIITTSNIRELRRKVARLIRCHHPEHIAEELDRLNRSSRP